MSEEGGIVKPIPGSWQPYCTKDGVVTVTWPQVTAVWTAIRIWKEVLRKERPDWSYQELEDHCSKHINMEKSCLLGRLLIHGRPPLPDPPPVVMAAPAYWLADPDLCPTCTGERAKPGLMISQIRRTNGIGNTGWESTFCTEPWHPQTGSGVES